MSAVLMAILVGGALIGGSLMAVRYPVLRPNNAAKIGLWACGVYLFTGFAGHNDNEAMLGMLLGYVGYRAWVYSQAKTQKA